MAIHEQIIEAVIDTLEEALEKADMKRKSIAERGKKIRRETRSLTDRFKSPQPDNKHHLGAVLHGGSGPRRNWNRETHG